MTFNGRQLLIEILKFCSAIYGLCNHFCCRVLTGLGLEPCVKCDYMARLQADGVICPGHSEVSNCYSDSDYMTTLFSYTLVGTELCNEMVLTMKDEHKCIAKSILVDVVLQIIPWRGGV